jgi:isoleucyl-tRNA synthetase
MRLARTIVGLGRTLRSKHKIKTRQPLSDVTVVAKSDEDRALIRDMEPIILEELNVKTLVFTERESDLVTLGAKANFRLLGKRFGKQMRDAAKVIETFDGETIQKLERGESVDVLGQPCKLEDIEITRVEHEGHVTETADGVTVSLTLDLTPELIAEGYARELKNRIQVMRKEADYHVADRIEVTVRASSAFIAKVECHADYLRSETLANQLIFSSDDAATDAVDAFREWDVDDELVWIGISRS